jgi:flagellar hook-associated protein 2
MATLQSLGVGSGMDLSSLVAQLVAAERAPKQQQITRQQSQVAVELSAMGTLKGGLSSFQSALSALKTSVSFDVFSAKSSDDEVFTATASASAPAGSYDVEVIRLAAAHQLSSGAFEDGDTVVGTGSLTIAVGEESFAIEIDAENSTLEEIRDAINSAEDNTGVRATIINGTDGAHLVLTGQETGEANAITVTATGSLGALAYSAAVPGAYTEVRAAQDALIEIAGTNHTSSSNTIEDAIEGVTLKLLKADLGITHTVNIERNLDALTTRVNAFVTQYNSAAGTMASLQSYNATTQQAGALLGDSLVRNIESSLRRELGRPVEGASADYNTLSSIGVTMKLDGKLELDQAKLREALETDFESVKHLFSSEDGIAHRMDEIVSPHLSTDGSISQRNKSLDDRTKKLEDDQAALDARMLVIEQRYSKQFTALDSLLAQLQSTSAYLGQQLANLPKIGKE